MPERSEEAPARFPESFIAASCSPRKSGQGPCDTPLAAGADRLGGGMRQTLGAEEATSKHSVALSLDPST